MKISPGISAKRNLSWYLKRISVMSPGEILSRTETIAGEMALKLVTAVSSKPIYVHDQEPGDFAFCGSALPVFSDFLLEIRPSLNLNELLHGKGYALGFEWNWEPSGACWHVAPDTGKKWPQRFYSDIPHGPGNPFGDVRVIWEPNRLQHLLALAIFYQNRHSSQPDTASEAASLAVKQIRSWWHHNLPLKGIHYKSVMECGLRILSLCHTMDLLRDSPFVDKDAWNVFLNIIYSHAKTISKRLSLHSSLGNHTVAECSGLLYAGLLFPEFKESDKWSKKALELLDAEAEHQILEDGGGAEQAFWYLRFIVDLYGCVVNLLHAKGLQVPESINKAVYRGTNFLAQVCLDKHYLPDVGDRDDGWALLPYSDRVSLFEKGTRALTGAVCLKSSGYTLAVSEKARVLFDHGPLGMAPSYGHGHADALSVQFFFEKEPVLIDPGTFCYNCDAAWRAYFRSTRAHNTVCLDGYDQAHQLTPFMWARPYKTQLIYFSKSKRQVIVVASHNGYRRLANPVTHTRGLACLNDGMVVVLDLLCGTGEHRVELNWHVAPDWKTINTKKGVLLEKSGVRIDLEITGGKLSILKGASYPLAGWYSKIYGKKSPINTINALYEGRLPCEFVTIISPDGSNRDAGVPELLKDLREIVGGAKKN